MKRNLTLKKNQCTKKVLIFLHCLVYNSILLPDKNTENKSIVYKKAIDLIDFRRFSVLSKYLLARDWSLNVSSKWSEKLYLELIRIWTNYKANWKTNKEEWLDSFKKTYISIKTNDFDENVSLVPIGDESFLDGEHRVACCLLFNKNIACQNLEHLPQKVNATALRFKKQGLKDIYLDTMAIEYTKKIPNTHIAILYPVAEGRYNEVIDIANQFGNVVHEKEVVLKNDGPLWLLSQLYMNTENWEFQERVIFQKNKICFNSGNPLQVVRIFLWESTSLDTARRCKEKIRDLFQLKPKHSSIHMTDTQEEAIIAASAVFNKNSIDFMNHAKFGLLPNFEKMFYLYRELLKEKEADLDCFCVDGSSILSIYGLRDSNDFDFLHHNYDDFFQFFKEGFRIESHNRFLNYYPLEKDELIFNPKNYFYFRGYKFLTLDLLEKMKSKRNTNKDKLDLELIEKLKRCHEIPSTTYTC